MAELLGDVSPGEPTDLLLETAGGMTDATEGLISLVQSVLSDFRVIVPKAAKSNGTLLCLASKEIVMGATSELGPIEPSINGIPSTILSQQQIAQQNYPLHMFGKYALDQTISLAKKLLLGGMLAGQEKKVEETVQLLASRDKFYSHGSVIDHREAIELGLNVAYLPPENDLWQRIWLLYCMYDHDCRKSRYLKVFEGRSRSTAVSVPPKPAAP